MLITVKICQQVRILRRQLVKNFNAGESINLALVVYFLVVELGPEILVSGLDTRVLVAGLNNGQ